MPNSDVRISDVTLRDGLQMEAATIPVEKKFELWTRLRACGYSRIEITSFVSPKWVPQFSDTDELCRRIFESDPGVPTMAFVPNEKGLERFLAYPIPWVGAFVAASETFNKKNVNASIPETLVSLKGLIARAKEAKRMVRVYVSTSFGCPYEGEMRVDSVMALLEKIVALRPDEIALSDTIGVAVPTQVSALLKPLLKIFPVDSIAMHLHNTYGLALGAAAAAYASGVRQFDGSTGGIGGCPYAKGATGNVAADELLYFFFREKAWPSFPLAQLENAFRYLSTDLGLKVSSRLWAIIEKGAKPYAIG